MGRGVVWIEFQRTLELFLRAHKVPIVKGKCIGQRSVRFGKLIINGERFLRCFSCLAKTLFWRGRQVLREQLITVCQTRISASVIRIYRYRLLVVTNTLSQAFNGTSLIEEVTAGYIKTVGFCIFAGAPQE